MPKKQLIVRDATGHVVQLPLSFQVVEELDEREARVKMVEEGARSLSIKQKWRQFDAAIREIQKQNDAVLYGTPA